MSKLYILNTYSSESPFRWWDNDNNKVPSKHIEDFIDGVNLKWIELDRSKFHFIFNGTSASTSVPMNYNIDNIYFKYQVEDDKNIFIYLYPSNAIPDLSNTKYYSVNLVVDYIMTIVKRDLDTLIRVNPNVQVQRWLSKRFLENGKGERYLDFYNQNNLKHIPIIEVPEYDVKSTPNKFISTFNVSYIPNIKVEVEKSYSNRVLSIGTNKVMRGDFYSKPSLSPNITFTTAKNKSTPYFDVNYNGVIYRAGIKLDVTYNTNVARIPLDVGSQSSSATFTSKTGKWIYAITKVKSSFIKYTDNKPDGNMNASGNGVNCFLEFKLVHNSSSGNDDLSKAYFIADNPVKMDIEDNTIIVAIPENNLEVTTALINSSVCLKYIQSYLAPDEIGINTILNSQIIYGETCNIYGRILKDGENIESLLQINEDWKANAYKCLENHSPTIPANEPVFYTPTYRYTSFNIEEASGVNFDIFTDSTLYLNVGSTFVYGLKQIFNYPNTLGSRECGETKDYPYASRSYDGFIASNGGAIALAESKVDNANITKGVSIGATVFGIAATAASIAITAATGGAGAALLPAVIGIGTALGIGSSITNDSLNLTNAKNELAQMKQSLAESPNILEGEYILGVTPSSISRLTYNTAKDYYLSASWRAICYTGYTVNEQKSFGSLFCRNVYNVFQLSSNNDFEYLLFLLKNSNTPPYLNCKAYHTLTMNMLMNGIIIINQPIGVGKDLPDLTGIKNNWEI